MRNGSLPEIRQDALSRRRSRFRPRQSLLSIAFHVRESWSCVCSLGDGMSSILKLLHTRRLRHTLPPDQRQRASGDSHAGETRHEDDKAIVACHDAGHALIVEARPHVDRISKILNEAYARARSTLVAKRSILQSLAELLLEKEVVDRGTLDRLVAASESTASAEVAHLVAVWPNYFEVVLEPERHAKPIHYSAVLNHSSRIAPRSMSGAMRQMWPCPSRIRITLPGTRADM